MAMTPITVGIINASGGTSYVRAGQNPDGSISFFNNLEIAGALVGEGNPLPTVGAGSMGSDSSTNGGALPQYVGGTIGVSTYGGAGPFSAYVLVANCNANPARAAIDVENVSGSQVVCVRDDGTAAPGAPPANASWFLLSGGAGAPSQGGSWSMNTFKGRLQIWAPADPGANNRPTIMVD